MSTNVFIPVRDVLNTNPVLIDGLATIQEALQLMRDHQVSALIVKRRDERDEFGILLLTEIAKQVVSQGRSLTRTNVYEVMLKPTPSIAAEMDIRYAIRHMTRYGLSHCVVMNGRELAGVVTLSQMTLAYAQT